MRRFAFAVLVLAPLLTAPLLAQDSAAPRPRAPALRRLEGRQLAIRRALALQLRPGTAADQDSVAKLTDDLLSGRVAYAQTFRDELTELKGYLNPVQRAQLMAMRERLLLRAQQFRDRQGGAGDGFRGRRRPFMER